jgi:hypothetical protein
VSYLGDYQLAQTIVFDFNTASFADGSPITLAGTPTLACYKNSTTESTSGITLTVDYDGLTGFHHVAINTATDLVFYAALNNFSVVITAGTVGGTSVVGRVVGSFSLNNRSALRPTFTGRSLDVSATGEAGIDWANIGSPTATVNLSGTNIDVDQIVASVSGAVGSVTGAVGSVTGNVGGNVTGSVNSVATTVSADVVSISGDSTAADNLERWFDGTVGFGTATSVITGSLSGAVGSVTAGVTVTTNNDKTGYSLSQAFPNNFSSMAINATGGVGIDWGNVQDPGATVDLTQTSILQVQDAVSVSDLDATAVTQIWSNLSRTLTAGTNIALTKGVGLLGLNDIAATAVVSGGVINTSGGAVTTVTTVTTNNDKTGYSLTQAFPANFDTLIITASGVINANLEEIKEAPLTQSGLGQLAGSFSHMFDSNSPVFTVESVNQTGDSFARVGANGGGLTALGDTRIANLDATVSSRMATYTQPTGFLAATFPSTVASPTNITSATGVVLSTAGNEAAADTTLRRTMANVEASASGDTLGLSSIYGFVQMAQESAVSGTTLTVKKTDGTTTLGTKTVATDAGADPITGVS